MEPSLGSPQSESLENTRVPQVPGGSLKSSVLGSSTLMEDTDVSGKQKSSLDYKNKQTNVRHENKMQRKIIKESSQWVCL